MPIVLIDFNNDTWCTEQMTDGFLHAGYTGSAGPRLKDLLDFAGTRQKQFDQFVMRRQQEAMKNATKKNNIARRTIRSRDLRSSEDSREG